MAHPAHHFSVHRFLGRRQTRTSVDRLAYFIGVVGNIAVLPQIIKAWEADAPGLAITTWIMFMFFGFIWLIYAIQHRQKPLIVAQVVGISCNIAVVSGWAFNTFIR